MNAQEIADRYWEFHLREFQFYNLNLGELTYLERWDDLSPEGVERVRRELAVIAAEAARIAENATGADRDLAETVVAGAEMNASEKRWIAELAVPNLQSGLVSWLLPLVTMQPLHTAEDGERYLTKIGSFPVLVDQIEEGLRAGAAAGVVPTALNTAATIAKIDELLATAESRARFVGQPSPTEIDADRWRTRLGQVVEKSMIPAIARFADVLRTVTLPVGRPEDRPGLCHLDGGDEVYRERARTYTTLDLSPTEIHRIGEEQVASIEAEYRALAGPLLGTDRLDEIYHRLRTDSSLHHRSAEAVVADAMRCLAKAEAAMGKWFGRLPQAPCLGSPIDVGAMAYYRSPSEDGTQPGQFFFNTADPSAWYTFQVAAIAYHEAIPGHHLDIALSLEKRDLHDVHRKVFLPAFGEGWALYTERLADEMGLYENDWERVGMLMGDSLRACRLVVDTGIHAFGWSRQRAIDYMVEHSPMSLHEITEEVDRYIGLPGQALSYMLGRLEIVDMRRRAEKLLGDRFDIRAFHDTALGSGSLSLRTLRRRVDEWMERVPAQTS